MWGRGGGWGGVRVREEGKVRCGEGVEVREGLRLGLGEG